MRSTLQGQHALSRYGIKSRIAHVTVFAIYGTAVQGLKSGSRSHFVESQGDASETFFGFVVE
jgi:hypothetical protein